VLALSRNNEDTNALVLVPKAAAAGVNTVLESEKSTEDAAQLSGKQLSKSQKRKLRKIEEEKAKRAQRAKVRRCCIGKHVTAHLINSNK
jgi:hypothetical protein